MGEFSVVGQDPGEVVAKQISSLQRNPCKSVRLQKYVNYRCVYVCKQQYMSMLHDTLLPRSYKRYLRDDLMQQNEGKCTHTNKQLDHSLLYCQILVFGELQSRERISVLYLFRIYDNNLTVAAAADFYLQYIAGVIMPLFFLLFFFFSFFHIMIRKPCLPPIIVTQSVINVLNKVGVVYQLRNQKNQK